MKLMADIYLLEAKLIEMEQLLEELEQKEIFSKSENLAENFLSTAR